ncbi:MAG: nucleotide excision repair endonuclease [Verrucomicrobia bacterium]|nr:nucleotide excision repair endonuclease [Verrucomicrobiota bacterium]
MDKNTEQLLLFDLPNPLTKTVGRAFFLGLPEQPGVYQFRDEEKKILYIGKSKNLKQRLNSYRSIKAEKADKRLVRLVNATAAITFETCSSEKAALRRENKLIRKYNPRYNRAQVYPNKNPYLICRYEGHRFSIRRQSGEEIPQVKGDEMLFGSFPAGMTPRALRAWQRLLLVLQSKSKDGFALPDNVMENQYYKQLTLSFGRGWLNTWIQKHFLSYLEGKHRLALWALSAPLLITLMSMDRPLRRLCWQDWKFAYRFFAAGPRRNRKLNKSRGFRPDNPISPANVSDWQLDRRLSTTG